MRTTLDIDDDVLTAAKELARRKNLSTGQVVSQLLRKVLTGQADGAHAAADSDSGGRSVAGFRPFPAGKAVVSNEAVNRLRDAEGI
jgi:Arc/MetJ family transcription regulator